MSIPNNDIRPGKKYPLGASWTGKGVNFAVYSENATMVVLCLFDKNGRELKPGIHMNHSEGVWHCFLPQAKPGLRYGFRAHGSFDPNHGLYFNPDKLLLDPYAKAVSGELINCDALYGYEKYTHSSNDSLRKTNLLSRDVRNSAPYMFKGVVVDDKAFDWEGDRPLQRPLNETILYEMHVKGFSMLNTALPEKIRGTYAGLAHPESIKYLTNLGITAVELLPIHLSISEGRLGAMGLSNYWGYNSLGFFCPDPRFSSAPDAVHEFKYMVKALHKAGIEVILDVVYNHTAEQGNDGPQLSLRGLDNPTYYRLEPSCQHHYCNFTGCGNSLDTRNPRTLQLIADSLRYWVSEMHVDGFRFDLATTLARTTSDNNYRTHSSFLGVLAQDPILNCTKLIAEPWDCGPNGYQVGKFPKGWSEWNGDWRDTVRRFWRGDGGLLGKMASKLSGSSDLYWDRSPLASVNFATAHDGFTLYDLVTYQQKRNHANGEDNRDGTNDNNNWNCGHEGPTSNEAVMNLRWRQMRNFILTIILSQGIPMLLGGDEIARTQNGNNNAYCQDNETSYYNWNITPQQQQLFQFTKSVIDLRRRHPAFRRSTFFRGQTESGAKDVIWLNVNGQEMYGSDWEQQSCGAFGMYIDGSWLDDTDDKCNKLKDSSFLLLFNNDVCPREFNLPIPKPWAEWQVIINTCTDQFRHKVSKYYTLPPHSSAVLEECPRSGNSLKS
ncbi:MAG: glycogen debranching protein GlgX [Candidatus Bruticola sp.]